MVFCLRLSQSIRFHMVCFLSSGIWQFLVYAPVCVIYAFVCPSVCVNYIEHQLKVDCCIVPLWNGHVYHVLPCDAIELNSPIRFMNMNKWTSFWKLIWVTSQRRIYESSPPSTFFLIFFFSWFTSLTVNAFIFLEIIRKKNSRIDTSKEVGSGWTYGTHVKSTFTIFHFFNSEAVFSRRKIIFMSTIASKSSVCSAHLATSVCKTRLICQFIKGREGWRRTEGAWVHKKLAVRDINKNIDSICDIVIGTYTRHGTHTHHTEPNTNSNK